MTVKELIAELEKQDPEMEVQVYRHSRDDGDYYDPDVDIETHLGKTFVLVH